MPQSITDLCRRRRRRGELQELVDKGVHLRVADRPHEPIHQLALRYRGWQGPGSVACSGHCPCIIASMACLKDTQDGRQAADLQLIDRDLRELIGVQLSQNDSARVLPSLHNPAGSEDGLQTTVALRKWDLFSGTHQRFQFRCQLLAGLAPICITR
jgi:hypothetical protein